MGLFGSKKTDYLLYVEPPKVEETMDLRHNLLEYIKVYRQEVCQGKELRKYLLQADREVGDMTDEELMQSCQNGWTSEMQAVYILKGVLIDVLPQITSAKVKQDLYTFNKQLMSRAMDLNITTKRQAKKEDAEMRQRCGVSSV